MGIIFTLAFRETQNNNQPEVITGWKAAKVNAILEA